MLSGPPAATSWGKYGRPYHGSMILHMRCPECGDRTLSLAVELVAKPLGTYALGGSQMKVAARELPVLRCRACGLHMVGEWDGRHAVFSRNDLARPAVDPVVLPGHLVGQAQEHGEVVGTDHSDNEGGQAEAEPQNGDEVHQ